MAATSIPIPKLFHFLNAYRAQRLKTFLAACRNIRAYTFEHLMFLGGLAAIAYGAWMIWHPLGPVVGGWFALKVSFLVSAERQGQR